MLFVTKGMVAVAALVASGFTIADEAFTRFVPAAKDQNLFQIGTEPDGFNELRQQASAALQTLIDKQQANKQQQISAAAEGDQLNIGPIGPTCSQRPWPYYESYCLRDRLQAGGNAGSVRLVTTDRLSAALTDTPVTK